MLTFKNALSKTL